METSCLQHNKISTTQWKQAACNTTKLAQHNGNKLQHNEINLEQHNGNKPQHNRSKLQHNEN